ncbi:hypothetical protein FHU13_005532 [Methylobacterium sp. R2-1]|nr:hypothetical protein [Methylobacterium sp. R2-1]
MARFTHQLAGDGLTPATREVPLPELVSTYLRAVAPSAYCDPCLASAVREPLELVHQTAEALEGPGQFARKVGRCKVCRSTKRVVTRVEPVRLARGRRLAVSA